MIDLHCHFLPGIDDGAETLEQALALARLAVEDGIQVSVMTPHIHSGWYDNDRESIERARVSFQQALTAEGIPLLVRTGGEVRLGGEVMDLLEQDMIPFYGTWDGYRVMLLEFPHSHIPVGADRLVRWLIERRVRPLIAHPERNKDLIKSPEKIRPFMDMGCFLQVTAGSVFGQFGPGSAAAAAYYLEQDWVFALATDAHDTRHRVPNLSRARDYLADTGRAELAELLTSHNPARLIGNGSPSLQV